MDSSFHKLAIRQLKKSEIDPERIEPKLKKFVELVSAAYYEAEGDRRLLEHAIEVSSREMSEANQQLRALVVESQKSAHFKANFLANMSHEIRTPINGILGLTDMLKDLTNDSNSLELIELLSRSTTGLLSIINDVLDLSKIEAGKIALLNRDTCIKQLTSDIAALFIGASHSRGIQVVVEINADVPEWVRIDDNRLKQILTNLIGNAVKFTPDHGGVLIYIEIVKLDIESPLLQFTVADSGIGIASEHLSLIFDTFSQVNSTDTRKFGGTGLGLAITQRLVNLMGGVISVRSKLDVGSAFRVQLPFGEVSVRDSVQFKNLSQAGSIEPCDMAQIRVLVAEDNQINEKVVVSILKKMGFATESVGTGKAALAAHKKQGFDLILMDCQMPEMSGFEATTLIRQLDKGANVPVLALTALAMEGDREKCLTCGMNDYISKPINRQEFERTIRQWVERISLSKNSGS